jgi:predicted nuclease of predicted toxin-antitoxin system
LKFLVDMPLSPTLAGWLVQQGHDAIYASQVGLDRASDITIVEHAQQS